MRLSNVLAQIHHFYYPQTKHTEMNEHGDCGESSGFDKALS